MKQIPSPDLSSVIDAAKNDVKITLNAVKIGKIEEFFPSTQTASVSVGFSQIKEILPNGTRIIEDYPLILECPVVTMFGGDSFINLPIQSGDSCLLFFNDRQLDGWLNTGEVNPPDVSRYHDISDAIALVGIRHYQNSISQFLANGIRISFANDSRIDLQEDAINSVAELFTHTGNMRITGSLTIDGDTYGNGGTWWLNSTLRQRPGFSLHAANGATGTFNVVTVQDGIVTGGS